jgi:hypothetical protein
MQKNSFSKFSQSSITLLAGLLVFLIYWILTLSTYQYIRLTADSTLYLSIAEKYLRWEFMDAINGYWGPMLSWLLIPFLYFGSSHVFAINTLDLIFCLFTITGIWKLSLKVEMNENVRSAVVLSSFPIVFFYSLVQPFDLLLICILVYYLSIVFSNNYPERITNGIASGVLGSIAYFSKSYALPFFIAHFLAMNILHLLKCATAFDRKKVLKNVLAGFILFSLISGIWVALLSNKYGYFTFSNMGKTNLAILAPGHPEGGLEFGQPMFYKGFFEPPNKTAIVAWEDPSYINVEAWSPLGSWGYLKHFMKLILNNIYHALNIYEFFSTLSIGIIITYILLFTAQPFKEIIKRGELIYPLITIIIYTGGYLPFHFEERYIWIVNILLLLMGGYVLSVLFQKEFFRSKTRKNIMIVCFIASFIFTPIKLTIQGRNSMDKEMHDLNTELKHFGIQGNIASNREYVPVHDSWHKTFRMAYWLKGRYYGQAKQGTNDEDLENEIKKYKIDYYFFWGESTGLPPFLSQYKELTSGKIPGLKIYSLKSKQNSDD